MCRSKHNHLPGTMSDSAWQVAGRPCGVQPGVGCSQAKAGDVPDTESGRGAVLCGQEEQRTRQGAASWASGLHRAE